MPRDNITITLTPAEVDALARALDYAADEKTSYLEYGNPKMDGYSAEDLAGIAETFRAIGSAGEKLGFHGEADRWGQLAETVEGVYQGEHTDVAPE